MEGLVWGAFLGGVVGMAKDIMGSEYAALQTERKERALARPHGFLYQVSDLETSFLCLYENCGGFAQARVKLDLAGQHLNKLAEIYTRQTESPADRATPLAHLVAGHNKELGVIALREATRDMLRGNPGVNANVVSSARRSVEGHVDDMYRFVHPRAPAAPPHPVHKRPRGRHQPPANKIVPPLAEAADGQPLCANAEAGPEPAELGRGADERAGP